MNNKVLEETLVAYSDSNNFTLLDRNLSFKASEPVSVADAIEIMTSALGGGDCGYNEFEPLVLEFFNDMDVTLTLAREVSVCVYVNNVPESETSNKYWQDGWLKNLRADEVDVEDAAGTIRVWWD